MEEQRMQPVTLAYFVARDPAAGLTPFQLLDAPDLSGETKFSVVCVGRYSPALEIRDWTFEINQTSASSSPPASVLINKYCCGSLLDRVRQNVQTWPRVDNPYSPQELRTWLLKYIYKAITYANAESPSAPFYQTFVRLVLDKSWHGSIILNVPLNACDTLPPDLSWMGSQIPDGTLVAHHIAFALAELITEPIFPTTVSAMVSYPPQPNDATAGPFLRARFANSALVDIQHTPKPVAIQPA